MKQSWIVGCVMAYMLIFVCEMFATGGVSLSATTSSNMTNVATANQTAFLAPTFAESTNVFTAAWAVVKGIAPYLTLLAQVVFLYCPTVFSGYLLYFYWFICFPVSVGFIAGLVFIVRGVHSA